ncbi:MAG: site-specific integrase [Leeuwenhoekiella sp.]
MKTSLTLTLDTRRQKKDGTYPIIFRLSHHRKTIPLSTGFSIEEKNWNIKSGKVRNGYKGVYSVLRFNNLLAKKKSEYIDQINELEENGQLTHLSINELKRVLTNQKINQTVFGFTQELIKDLNKAKRFGNARAYKCALGALKNFQKGRDLRFEEITYRFLTQFENDHLQKGNSLNGLSTYLRTLRAIYNKAINQGIVGQEHYPFRQYKIKSAPTAKRAISKEKIKRIVAMSIEPGSTLFNARNYFLASYLMNGISFIDLAFLKVENIIDGRIKYQRKKTARHYDVKVTDQLNSFLVYYLEGKSKDDFIFPIIRRSKLIDQYNDVRRLQKKYNADLKLIAQQCDIEERLTSYVSRHSMATHLILNDVPINALSKMLGHSTIQTTQIYIKDLPTDVLDEYQERLHL